MTLDVARLRAEEKEYDDENGRYLKIEIGEQKDVLFLDKEPVKSVEKGDHGDYRKLTFFVIDLNTKSQAEKEFGVSGKKLRDAIFTGIENGYTALRLKNKGNGVWEVIPVPEKKK